MEEKPELRRYLKAQNDPYYKITGIIKGENGERTFYETNYARNKCIIDVIILIVVVALFTIVFILSAIATLSKNTHYYHNDTIAIILTVLIMPSWHIVVPFLARLIRTVFGLRLFFMQFNDNETELKEGYLRFYNNFISNQISYTTNKEEAASKEILVEYYKNDPNAKRKIFKVIKVVFSLSYSILIFCVVLMFALNVISLGFAFILSGAGFLLLYVLSHAATYFFWQRG